MPKFYMLLILCLTFPALSGCEQITGVAHVQVIGEVRMDRKPLADTMVAFIPLEFRNGSGTIREIAFGKTNNAGRFELRTSDAKGVQSAEYRVLFFRPDLAEKDEEGSQSQPQYDGETQDDGETSGEKWMQDVLERTDLNALSSFETSKLNAGGIPATYNIESTLRFTVKLGAGILYPKFELESHPEI